MRVNFINRPYYRLLVLMAGIFVAIAADKAYAQQGVDKQGQEKKGKKSYSKRLFINICSQDYYNFLNPGDKLDSKGYKQMVNHIRASCQCLYKNLNKVFSKTDILHYVQSRHVSSASASRKYGQTPLQVYNVMTSEELREECHHLNDMGASFDDGT